jgi:hypothetical protein
MMPTAFVATDLSMPTLLTMRLTSSSMAPTRLARKKLGNHIAHQTSGNTRYLRANGHKVLQTHNARVIRHDFKRDESPVTR